MPIVAADLKAFLPVNRPEDDTVTAGGIIQDEDHASGGAKPEFTDIAADDDLEAVSDGADTRTLTITARDAGGAIVSEALALNGTSAVVFSTMGVVERFMKGVLGTLDGTRTVTIRRSVGGATVATLGPNVTEAKRMFYDNASAGTQQINFELIYLKNDHATLDLTNAKVQITVDTEGVIRQGIHTAKGSAGTITNRATAPGGGVTFVADSTQQSVPTTILAAQEHIGVWIEQDLAIDYAAFKSTFTVELAGNTV
jgi:hypothetical protein